MNVVWTASIIFVLFGKFSCQRVSAPECSDGSSASCVCGDGSQPDYSKFPPCEIKKGVKKPTCSCPPGQSLAPKYIIRPPKRPCAKGRWEKTNYWDGFKILVSDQPVLTNQRFSIWNVLTVEFLLWVSEHFQSVPLVNKYKHRDKSFIIENLYNIMDFHFR